MTWRVRHWDGLCDYQTIWQAMYDFVSVATEETKEELWLLQHPSVYTLGQSGSRQHLLSVDEQRIAVIKTDRGGQVTYHGAGQLIIYLMLNVGRRPYGLRELVRRLEAAIIALLADYDIEAYGDVLAPGVYVGGEKIASLGLRVRRGWTYHGISLNVAMDLAPFLSINPCGYAGLKVTQIHTFRSDISLEQSAQDIVRHLESKLSFI